MLDKVDVRVPDSTGPGPALAEPFEQLRKRPTSPFRPSHRYQYTCDLREVFGIDAVVHLWFRHGRPMHKIEIVDAGEKTLADMEQIITQLFNVDVRMLELLRIDLAADIEDVPVPWFREHSFVNRKQFSARIEKSAESELQFVGMSTAHAQTIYAGKRPNLIRVYDKLAEWYIQVKRLERDAKRFNARMDGMDLTEEQIFYGKRIPPTFEEFCKARGYTYRQNSVLTRVERQMGGQRLPEALRTFGDLYRAHEFTPFEALRIVPGSSHGFIAEPPRGVSVHNWLASLGFNALQQHLGSAQLASSLVMRLGRGNGKRVLQSLSESAPRLFPPVTIDDIQESYRKSTIVQTSLSADSGLYLTPTYEYSK
jgi:hypothetical protein